MTSTNLLPLYLGPYSDSSSEYLPPNGLNGYFQVDDTKLRIALGKIWEVERFKYPGTDFSRKLAAVKLMSLPRINSLS